jgi:pyruvate/2-oxoglutarate dehydrogenase complex dihydrolipoamide dehydrogenase (E3) component
MYTLVVIRHGESEWNKKNLFCGWTDVELSDKGMKELENVKVYMGYTPEEVKGDKKVQGLVIKNKADGKTEELSVDGVFVEAGGIPNNSYLPSDVKVNSLGEIMTNKEGETNVDGLFAAGDVTDCRNKQVIIAAEPHLFLSIPSRSLHDPFPTHNPALLPEVLPPGVRLPAG